MEVWIPIVAAEAEQASELEERPGHGPDRGFCARQGARFERSAWTGSWSEGEDTSNGSYASTSRTTTSTELTKRWDSGLRLIRETGHTSEYAIRIRSCDARS